jgi:DNA-binding NarL/FixJ family response regulator
MSTRVLLADDHVIFRQGLKAMLERDGIEVVAQVSDGREAVRMARQIEPDVAVLDFAMPVLNGLDAASEVVRASSRTRPILLTMHTEDRYVLEALRAGVRGYVLKTQAAADLVRAIHDVAEGLVYLSPVISQTVVQAYLTRTELPQDPLSPREREVLQLVAEGKTSKAIADILKVSVKTAESHRARIMERLDVHQTAGLVRYAVRRGLIQP